MRCQRAVATRPSESCLFDPSQASCVWKHPSFDLEHTRSKATFSSDIKRCINLSSAEPQSRPHKDLECDQDSWRQADEKLFDAIFELLCYFINLIVRDTEATKVCHQGESDSRALKTVVLEHMFTTTRLVTLITSCSKRQPARSSTSDRSL